MTNEGPLDTSVIRAAQGHSPVYLRRFSISLRAPPKTALHVIDRITARSQQLRDAPNSGRRVPEYERSDVRELLEKPYRIIYKIKADQVDVLTVMHDRQLLPQDIKQL